jgi:hypothetical protein
MAVLRLPYRDRNQPLTDPEVLRLSEALEDRAERVTVDRLLVEAMGDPDLHTVGDLLDRIERASPQERRRLVDEGRVAGAQGERCRSRLRRDPRRARLGREGG